MSVQTGWGQTAELLEYVEYEFIAISPVLMVQVRRQ